MVFLKRFSQLPVLEHHLHEIEGMQDKVARLDKNTSVKGYRMVNHVGMEV